MTQSERRQLTVREATAADLDAIRILYRSVWGYQRPYEFDRWRYLTPPDGLCPMALAEDGSRLAGAYTIWPVRLRVDGEVVLGAQSMDTMTHPEYQGQGIFTRLAESCFEIAQARGYRLLYGFPNSASYPGFVRRLGWTHTGDVTHWVRPIKPSHHPRVPRALGAVADALTGCLPRGRRRGFVVRPIGGGEADLQPLLETWHRQGSCEVERTMDWMRWRYAEAAVSGYRWVGAFADGRLAAAGAWGMRGHAWAGLADRRAHLVELLGPDEAAMGAALAAIIDDVRSAGAMLLETLCNVDRVCRVLRRASFYRHRQAPLIVKSLGASFPIDVLDHGRWRIMGGDVDTF